MEVFDEKLEQIGKERVQMEQQLVSIESALEQTKADLHRLDGAWRVVSQMKNELLTARSEPVEVEVG